MIIQITDKEMEKLLEFIDKGGKTIRLQSQTENIKVEIKQKRWKNNVWYGSSIYRKT